MDYTLQIHGEKRVYPVPNGLYELLSDIVREVLRAQPSTIIPFIGDYLQALVTTRELSKNAIEIVDSVLTAGEENIRLCLRLGITLDEANRAAATIQAAWRGYVVRKRFRKKEGRDKEKRGQHFVDVEKQERDRQLAEDLDQFLERKKITYLEASTAARIIQAAWKGYKERVLRKHVGRSDESLLGWAHPWLKEFDKKPVEKDEKPFPKAKLFPQRTSSLLYLPRRPIMADPQRLKALFHGQKEDYDSLERSLSKLMGGEFIDSEVEQRTVAPLEILDPYAFLPPVEEVKKESETKPAEEELYRKAYGFGEEETVEREEAWSEEEDDDVPIEQKMKTAWASEDEEEVVKSVEEPVPKEIETELPRLERSPSDTPSSKKNQTEEARVRTEDKEDEGRGQVVEEAILSSGREDEADEEMTSSASDEVANKKEPQTVPPVVSDEEPGTGTSDEAFTDYSENEDTVDLQTEATTD